MPGLARVAGWLDANRPAARRPALMHGDYSPYNVMASPRDPRRLAAVIDWDTGTIGDPLLDIGHLLARWTEPGEEPVINVQAGGIDGDPTRGAMADRYVARAGRDLSALGFFEVFALFKLAGILQGTVARGRAAG